MSTKQALLTVNPLTVPAGHPDASTPAAPVPTRIANSAVILPTWVYIKGSDGRYLYERSGPEYSHLSFRSGALDLDNVFEARPLSGYPGWFDFIGRSGNNINRYYSGWYSTAPGGIDFQVIPASGNKVYLKDDGSSQLFFSNDLKDSGSPLGHDYINDSSLMEISPAAVKYEITNVQYDIDGGQVRQATPLIALSTSVRNDSDSTVSQTLTYSYEKSNVGTWNNTAGIQVGVKTTFEAGVPFVADAKFEISVTASYSHQWGGSVGEKKTVTESTTVTVPPRKKANATIIVRNAQIDVDFTYTQDILWSNGKTEQTTQSGTYSNVDSWHVDVQLDNWENV